MKKKLYFFLILFNCLLSFSQNTVGTVSYSIDSYSGYTLFAPLASSETYLINNCGEVIHQWTSTYTPAASVYLLENGNLLRTGRISNTNISFGGVGGKIELFDWDNNLLWEYTYSSPNITQHHDVYPLDNGNILMLAVTTMPQNEAIQAGRDPSKILEGKIYNEQIIELEPILGTDTANIVWEWNIKDHLIQDFDATKDNFGVVADHPELLDFNYLNVENGNANWLHINSLQYNEDLKQIILSSRLLDELYIIEHTTSTADATGHTGGQYGKGGDFLYRWGNPESYDHGTPDDKLLFSQHYPHWIPEGLNDAGKIIVFNNGNSIRFSSVDILSPPTSAPGVYVYDDTLGYGPTTYDWTYVDPIDPENFFSSILSGAQRLPNGNTLICDGDSGYFFELDTSNNIVWEYINPDSANGILTQGETSIANLVFRAHKFSPDYPAFIGKDLTPGIPIELEYDISSCTSLSIADVMVSEVTVYPNPTKDILNIDTAHQVDKIDIYNILGEIVLTDNKTSRIDVSNLSDGIYTLKIESNRNSIFKRIIKK